MAIWGEIENDYGLKYNRHIWIPKSMFYFIRRFENWWPQYNKNSINWHLTCLEF